MLPSANTRPPPDPEEILIEPLTSNLYPGLVVPMPTLAPDVVAMVAVPAIDIVDAVTEPVDVIVVAVIEPFSSTLKAPFAAVKVPVVTVILLAVTLAAVIEPVSSTLKAPFATVSVPVDTVILDAVIEPVEPTTKLLLAAVKVPVTVAEPVVVNVVTVAEPAVSDVAEMLVAEMFVEEILLLPAMSPTNPCVAVTVPITTNAVCGVVVPTPTLPVLKTFNIFVVVPTANNVAGVVVPMPTLPPLAAAVNVPVNDRLDAVIEPFAVSVVAVSDPTVALVALSVVMFPVAAFITAAVIEPVFPFTANNPPAAVNVPLTVAEPVVVSVVTVVEPKLAPPVDVIPAAVNAPDAVIVPFAVSVVTVVEPAVSEPVVMAVALIFVVSIFVVLTLVPPDKLPTNPLVAVIVPITYNAVPGVVVPTPTLPSFLTYRVLVPEVLTTWSDAAVLAEDEPAI